MKLLISSVVVISLINNSEKNSLISEGSLFLPILYSGFMLPKIRNLCFLWYSFILLLFIIKIEFPSKIDFNLSKILSEAKLISSNKIHSSFFIACNKIPSRYLKLFFLFPFLFNCCINLDNSFINISISLITSCLLLSFN